MQQSGAIRNIGILAHIDAGKTTTTERILFYSGVIARMGEVHEGSAFTDWMTLEQERGISITAASTTFPWRGASVNLIDTPGHVDFTFEVERSLRVLDGAVVVVDAQRGVEPQTETVWRQADRYELPRLVFVNKCDRTGEAATAVATLRERLGARTLVVQLPHYANDAFAGVVDLVNLTYRSWDQSSKGLRFTDGPVPIDLIDAATAAREQLCEALCEVDDGFFEIYIAGLVDAHSLHRAIRRATTRRLGVPVLFGSSLRNQGIHNLLDAVVEYLPDPSERLTISAIVPTTGEFVQCPANAKAPLAAVAFKVVTSPTERITYVRVYGGVLRRGDVVRNADRDIGFTVDALVRMHANRREEIGEIAAGSIGAIVGGDIASTGDTLCDPNHLILLDRIAVPQSVIEVIMEPIAETDMPRLMMALEKLAAEDPSIRVALDHETSLPLVSGMGELHLEIASERLRREFGIDVRVGRPRVAFRETITGTATSEKIVVRQLGPVGQYGHVALTLEPARRGAGFSFKNEVPSDKVPRAFLPSIEEGIRDAVERGVVGGYLMTDILVRLVGGSAHPVDSAPSAYRQAAYQAFVDACAQCGPTIIEPVMSVLVETPDDSVGDVIGDLYARRGKITGISSQTGVQTVACLVPLAAMLGYATELRSKTRGRASFLMEFKEYQPISTTGKSGLGSRPHGQ